MPLATTSGPETFTIVPSVIYLIIPFTRRNFTAENPFGSVLFAPEQYVGADGALDILSHRVQRVSGAARSSRQRYYGRQRAVLVTVDKLRKLLAVILGDEDYAAARTDRLFQRVPCALVGLRLKDPEADRTEAQHILPSSDDNYILQTFHRPPLHVIL